MDKVKVTKKQAEALLTAFWIDLFAVTRTSLGTDRKHIEGGERGMNIEEIKQALAAATPDWHDNGNEIVSLQNKRCGIGGFLKDEDNFLAANAPTWLAQMLEERAVMVEALNKAQAFISSIMGYYGGGLQVHHMDGDEMELIKHALQKVGELP